MSVSVDQIERALEAVDLPVAVELTDHTVVLSGMVGSENERQAVHDVVLSLVPDLRVIDNLDILEVLPESLEGASLSEASVGDFAAATPDTTDNEALEPGDFTDQSILENAQGAAGPGYTAADEEISEGEEAYVPPTDPVRGRDNDILGGFKTSAMDDVESEIERSALDGAYGDEAIADAVRKMLRQDAATMDLSISVDVNEGIVRLRGSVGTIDDVESAEEVASRVPGVVEVQEELRVATL